MKIYEYNGLTFQYPEGKQPKGAVEVKVATPANKSVTPENKGVKDADSKPGPRSRRKPNA